MLFSRYFLQKICSKFLLNNSRTFTVSPTEFSNKINPGSRRRTQLLKENDEDSPEDLDFEADFSNVQRSHKEYIQEMNILKEKHQFDIVKQKYFKQIYPNFLTWHDKEQIRLLHNKDAEEWSVDKLSEGFPATPEIIHKVLKANWRPKSIEKVKKHDEKVRENWKKFRKNELNDLPKNLAVHLSKFSERDVNYGNYENMEFNNKIQFNINPSKAIFSKILTDYQKTGGNEKSIVRKELRLSSTEKKRSPLESNEDTYIQGEIKNKHPMTFETLKKDLQDKLEKGAEMSYSEISIVRESNSNSSSAPAQTEKQNNELTAAKYETGKLMVVDDKKSKDYNHLMYPEKIIIPKKIYKKGYTYKLNDCYYDSDGTFLYRVPGMY